MVRVAQIRVDHRVDPRSMPLAAQDRAHDTNILARLFSIGGMCCVKAQRSAISIMDRTTSFGAALASPPVKLRALGADDSQIEAVEAFNMAMALALRRRVEDRPILANSEVVVSYLFASMAHLPREEFRVLYLNTRLHLVHDETVSTGNLTAVPIEIRAIISRALDVNAAAILVAHNHPSGNPSPSVDDIACTRTLERSCSALGIRLLDHLIISDTGFCSLKNEGHIR